MTWLLLALAVSFLPNQELMDSLPREADGLNAQNILFLLLLATLIVPYAYPPDRWRPEWPRVGRKFASYLALAFVSLWYGLAMTTAVEPPVSIDDWRVQSWRDELTSGLIFVVASRCIRTEQQIRRILLAALIATGYFACHYLWQYYPEAERIALLRMPQGYTPEQWTDSKKWMIKRLAGVFVNLNSNSLAAYFLYAGVFFLGLCWHYRSACWRLLVLAVSVLLGMGILYSQSRGAMVAAVAAFGYAIFHRHKWLVRFASGGFVLTAVLAGGTEGLDNSAATRLELWSHAARFGIRYPMGVGYRLFPFKHRIEYGLKLDTHNYFMLAWAELGPLGLLFVLGFFLGGINLGWHLHRTARTPFSRGMGRGCAMMWAAVLVANIFGDRMTQVNLGVLVWSITGLTMALVLIEERQRLAEITPEMRALSNLAARLERA